IDGHREGRREVPVLRAVDDADLLNRERRRVEAVELVAFADDVDELRRVLAVDVAAARARGRAAVEEAGAGARVRARRRGAAVAAVADARRRRRRLAARARRGEGVLGLLRGASIKEGEGRAQPEKPSDALHPT